MSFEREGDLDARWADIIAHWDDPAPFDDPTAPPDAHAAASTVDEPAPAGTDRGADPPVGRRDPSVPEPVDPRLDGQRPDPIDSGWRAYEPPEEDEHWEPPAPAPLPPVHDHGFWAIAAALVLGPLLILFDVIVQPYYAQAIGLVGVALVVAGFLLLVHRGAKPGDDDDFGIRL